MKCEKNGFTFIELLFVALLLALLVIIAYPSILNAYLKAQKDTFLIEAKDIYGKSETKYASSLVNGKKLSTITDTDEISSLDYGEGKIKYCVKLSIGKKNSHTSCTGGGYMTGIAPIKKLLMSFIFAFIIIIYVPVACLVGTGSTEDADMALAETETFTEEATIELIEIESCCHE